MRASAFFCSFALGLHFLLQAAPVTAAVAPAPPAPSLRYPPSPSAVITEEDPAADPHTLGRGGSFRSPRMGYTGGNRARTPGVTTPGAPGARTPGVPAARPGGFLGGLFGGFLTGSLIGSLFHPFGFMGNGAVFALLSILFWGVILFLVYRLIKRALNRQRH